MSNESELIKYFSEHAVVAASSNLNELYEALENADKFEDKILSHPHMPATKKILIKLSTACDSEQDDEKKKKLLLDYSSFVKFLFDFYKGGIRQSDDGKLSVDNDWFSRQNLNSCFKSRELLNRYCDDREQDEICCEPILLFDDEGCVSEVHSLGGFPIVVANNVIDTQIMNEQEENVYNLTSLLPVLSGVFQTVKQLGTPELAQSVAALRSKIIQLNGKPISIKDKMLGRLSPPEGFILLRLAERLTNLKTEGSKILGAVQKAETEDNQITPEEFQEIQNYLIGVLRKPLKRVIPAVMGPLMSRTVEKLERDMYQLSPDFLASYFVQAIEQNSERFENVENKYYEATKQMFAALQSASNTANAAAAAATQAAQPSMQAATGGAAPSGQKQKSKTETYLNLQHPRSREAARAAISQVASLIQQGAKPEEVAAELAKLQKRFTPH